LHGDVSFAFEFYHEESAGVKMIARPRRVATAGLPSSSCLSAFTLRPNQDSVPDLFIAYIFFFPR
jgi:hypothetical protein